MQLSERMRRISSLVTEGNRLADIGTDHGYIPMALVQEGKIPSALAMDVNEGPLARAREHIRLAGLSARIETRRSDGLRELGAGEADTVLMAGMGGMLTVRILTEGGPGLWAVKELILQPQSDLHRVRRWLTENGWQIAAEDLAAEDGKYYPMMKAVRGSCRPLLDAELYYGQVSLQRSPEVLLSYLQVKQEEYRKILEHLKQSGREDTDRASEVRMQLGWIDITRKEVLRR